MEVYAVPYPAQLITVLSHRGYYYPILYLHYKKIFDLSSVFEIKAYCLTQHHTNPAVMRIVRLFRTQDNSLKNTMQFVHEQ